MKIEEMLQQIRENFAKLPEEKQEKLKATMNDVEFMELYTFQNIQSRAFASGIITKETAQFIYTNITEVPSVEKWQQLPYENKHLIMMLMQSLMKKGV